MNKQACATDIADDKYWYRYDPLEGLRRRASDNAFRARVGKIEGHYVHQQVVATHKSTGAPVYRCCFWNSLHEALKHADALDTQTDINVVQRIPKSHSFFCKFAKGIDEYLPTSATIFYGTDKAASRESVFSESAIPHADIEYLTRGGSWAPLNDSAMLRETMPPEWTPYRLRAMEDVPAEIWAREHQTDPINPGHTCVLIRQVFQRDVNLFNSAPSVAKLVAHLFSSMKTPASGINVYLAFDYRSHPQGLYQHIMHVAVNIKIPVWLRAFQSFLPASFVVRHGEITVDLIDLDLWCRNELYRHFGIEDRLEGDEQWRVDFHAIPAMMEGPRADTTSVVSV